MKQLKRDEVLEIYLNALAHVYDPHSDYMGHQQMESFSIAHEPQAVRHRRRCWRTRTATARFASWCRAGRRREAAC